MVIGIDYDDNDKVNEVVKTPLKHIFTAHSTTVTELVLFHYSTQVWLPVKELRH